MRDSDSYLNGLVTTPITFVSLFSFAFIQITSSNNEGRVSFFSFRIANSLLARVSRPDERKYYCVIRSVLFVYYEHDRADGRRRDGIRRYFRIIYLFAGLKSSFEVVLFGRIRPIATTSSTVPKRAMVGKRTIFGQVSA